MEETVARGLVAETGRILLEKRLVARTWGNFSARLDESRFVITPSGLGYETMCAEDTVLYDRDSGLWQGKREPSSEWGIHAEAYALLPDVGFVIHTHPICATAVGLTGADSLALSGEDRRYLGGLAWAEYGLPGTKTLRNHVAAALGTGAHTVMMVNHGVLIGGRDRAEAFARAERLEELCRASCPAEETESAADAAALLRSLCARYPTADLLDSPAARQWAALGEPLYAQLDDMAQMIGAYIPCARDEKKALSSLKHHAAVFLPCVGALVRGENADDTEALKLLVHKAAAAALHCREYGVDARLSRRDILRMRRHYIRRYAGKKKS